MVATIERTLWYETNQDRQELNQDDLLSRTEPLVILGEAGMGKSSLLEWLATHAGYAFCTARQLINRRDPMTLVGDNQNLVIDALDEVSAKREGDALDDVLDKLGQLEYPHFILACRVADWHNATGLETIQEQYNETPLALHLTPFGLDDALTFLVSTLGEEHAKTVVEHYKTHRLDDLLGNPQTLDFIAQVAKQGKLPESRYGLFEEMIEILRREHREAKINHQPAKEVGLDAAGAAFAGIILTGSEAIARTTAQEEGELTLAEVSCLPGGDIIETMLDTRLFTATGADRFSYTHRRIGEYLGARWLAKQADTPRKRRRLLALFHSSGLVPASLRGLHAWLLQAPALWQEVIEADPMGVIEYGDTDNLTIQQARLLLSALEHLAVKNPLFNEQNNKTVRGLAKPELLDELRRLITTSTTPFHLAYLVLTAIKRTQIAYDLEVDLCNLALDKASYYALRSAAGSALVDVLEKTEFKPLIDKIQLQGNVDAIRLAISLIQRLSFEYIEDNQLVDLIIASAQLDDTMFGVLMEWEMSLPTQRISGVLDQLIPEVRKLGSPLYRKGNYILADFSYHLIVRLVLVEETTAEKLWFWLEPFQAYIGYERNIYERFDSLIQDNNLLRRAVQYHVLLERKSDMSIHHKLAELKQRSAAFEPNTADIIALLNRLDPDDPTDERWRDLMRLVLHNQEKGAEVRVVARPFATHSPELLAWLEGLADPQIPDWQIEEDARHRQRQEEKAQMHAEHRKEYTSCMEEMRQGDYSCLYNPAQAYLGYFRDLNENTAAHERILEWLGDDLNQAALEGFEVFIQQSPQIPTACDFGKIKLEDKEYRPGYIMVATLAERFRKGIGFDEITDERLMASLIHVYHVDCDQRAGIEGLRAAIETAVQVRGLWRQTLQYFIEPQLAANRDFVQGLDLLTPSRTNLIALGLDLATEWLLRYPELPVGPETELIDILLREGQFDILCRISTTRVDRTNLEKRRNWDAVDLIIDFETTAERLETEPIEPELIWYIRNRTGEQFRHGSYVPLQPEQYGWIIKNYRSLWPAIERPRKITKGDTNPWDACDYIRHLIRHIGNDISEEAVLTLAKLLEEPEDGYTEMNRIVLAEQMRKRIETHYTPPSLDAINAISWNIAPNSAADLQAYVVEDLLSAQAKIKGDDVDSWRGFFDDNDIPFDEERCRDHLIGLLRQGTGEIAYDPEVHVANDKRVDIACSVGDLRMPVEIKGQWHDDLWTAADEQLDTLYTGDWKAEGRGVYLVLWFGEQHKKTKRLTSPGRGIKAPTNADEIRDMLIARSKSAQEARVDILVIDIALQN